MDMLNGKKVMVVPSVVNRKRSWQERLLSWPWRPFDSFELMKNPACPQRGQCYIASDVIYVSEESYADLQRECA